MIQASDTLAYNTQTSSCIPWCRVAQFCIRHFFISPCVLVVISFCELSTYYGDIYVSRCSNSRVILDFSMFWNCKLQNHPNFLGLNCHLSTYLALKSYYIHKLDCSQFRSKFETRKNWGLPCSCNSSQLSTWARKCHLGQTFLEKGLIIFCKFVANEARWNLKCIFT